jgi:hypothetical protein
MQLSKQRLQQIILEEVTNHKSRDVNEGDDHSRTVTQIETIGDIVSDALKESDNPEVVERLERADQLVTTLLKKLQGVGEPSFDSSGYSKVPGQRPMQENFENDQQFSDSKEDVLRQIVAQGQRAKVQGSMVDLFSAGAIVTVLDALSPENKEKYLEFHPYKMAEIAFKLTK